MAMDNRLDLDRYKDRMTSYKKSGNRVHIDRMQNAINDGFLKSPSYFPVLVNGVPKDVHIVEGLEGNNFLLTRPEETMEVGDLVEWNGTTHMCINKRHNTVVQTQMEIQMCNEMLTWQDENGVIYSVPTILLDKTSVYSDGISKKKHISIGTDQISMTVQSNEVTNRIPIDKRFIFAHDANNIYKVNRKDNILNKGLTLFVAKKDLYDEHLDRLDLGLANYSNPVDLPPVVDEDTTPDVDLVVTGNKRLTIWDEEVEYSVDTDLDVEWTIEPSNILEVVRTEGNKCYVSPISTSNIGESVITAKIKDNASYGRITVQLFYQ